MLINIKDYRYEYKVDKSCQCIKCLGGYWECYFLRKGSNEYPKELVWNNVKICLGKVNTGLVIGINGYFNHQCCNLINCFDFGKYFCIRVQHNNNWSLTHILVNSSGIKRMINDKFELYVPWSFNNHSDFSYPPLFSKLFITILAILKKHKIPRLLSIIKIFEPIWEYNRISWLDSVFDKIA